MYEGKLIVKKHLRLCEEMASEIEDIRKRERRSFQAQVRHLLEPSLLAYRMQRKETVASKRLMRTHGASREEVA